MSEKYQEYKCPKCLGWDDGFPKTIEGLKCNWCGYIGKLKEFEAKSYHLHIQSILRVIAFDEKDAKKELEKGGFMEEFPYFDKIIKIEEN